MKTIFTLLTALTFTTANISAQSCGYNAGGNGLSAAHGGITINGNMSDWAPYLIDADNNTFDNTNGVDLDAPTDVNRDLTRFTFTEDANNLYFFLERAGAGSNALDIVFYLDIDNDDIMEAGEPVFHINWSGSNGNASVQVKDYQPTLVSILMNTLSLNTDGHKLMGTLIHRNNQGSGSSTGKGSADGKSIEVKIPFSQITRLNVLGNVVDQLTFGENFKFHVSTINGNVSSIPGNNSINDNLGGCATAPILITVLPVKLESFNATLNSNNKADLSWTTASEFNVSHFVVEKSYDGANFTDAATVFAQGNSTTKNNYSVSDNIANASYPVIYYRLRSVDSDGKTSYSSIRTIRISKQANNTVTILTYPNPATNEVKITIPANWQNKKVVYELFSANGQAVQKVETNTSSQTEALNISNLKSGLYVVKVTCAGESVIQKIVKN